MAFIRVLRAVAEERDGLFRGGFAMKRSVNFWPIDAAAFSRFVLPMAMTLEQILEETRKLPPEQLSELIERITLAVHGPIDPKIEQAWTTTAMRRVAEMESGKVKPIPGHVTSARIRKIVGR